MICELPSNGLRLLLWWRGLYSGLIPVFCRYPSPFLLVLLSGCPCCQNIQKESKGRGEGGNVEEISCRVVSWYLLFSKSMVTCFCKVSYSTSFSFLSNLASFSLLAFLPELLGFQSSFFSFFVLG